MEFVSSQSSPSPNENKTSVFDLISVANFEGLKASGANLQPFLPYLVRMGEKWNDTTLFHLIHSAPQVYSITEYLELNLFELKDFISKERRLIHKLPPDQQSNVAESSLIGRFGDDTILQFENESKITRVKILLSDLLNAVAAFQQGRKQYDSSILGNEIYLSELSILLPVVVSQCSDVLYPEEVVSGLLLTPYSVPLIMSIIMNYPSCATSIIRLLLDHYDQFPFINELLLKICEMSNRLAYLIRQTLLDRKSLPSLMLQITLDILHDESSVLNHLFSKDLSWINDWHLKLQQEPPVIATLRKKLFFELQNLENENTFDSNMKLATLIRICCGFVMLLKIRLSQQDLSFLFRLFRSKISQSTKIAKLSLCFILVYKELIKHNKEEILAILNALKETTQFDELLLLIAIYFYTSQLPKLFEIIRDTLQMPVSIHSQSIVAIGELYTREIFTEKLLPQRALNLEIISNLSANDNKPPLAIICILQLVKARKFQIDPSEWIFSQLESIKEPIHPLIPILIEEYALCVAQQSSSFPLKTFSYEKVQPIFQGQGQMSTRIILLYFVLSFNEQSNKKAIEDKTKKFPTNIYPRELIDSLPIRAILSYIESHSEHYQYVYPKLFSSIISNYPQIFGVVQLLHEEENKYRSKSFKTAVISTWEESFGNKIGIEDVKKALLNASNDTIQATIILEYLSTLSSEELWNFKSAILDSLVSQILEFKIENHLVKLFQAIWYKLSFFNSWEINLHMLNLLKILEKDTFGEPLVYTHSLLVNNPVLILRLNLNVFRSPTLLEIFLQILGSYMHASRRHLSLQSQILQEESGTLTLAQESAIVQQLLEILQEKPNIEKGYLEEIRVLICTFLHDLFIETSLMIKLVHFQGYNPELLPITVNGIPSMHICLEFIPEFLSQPQIEKQIFGVKLGAHLVEKYPLAKSLDLARVILTHIHSHITDASSDHITKPSISSQQHPSFLLETLPTLVQLCTAFPLLIEDSIKILQELMPSQKMATQYLNSSSSHLSRTIHQTFQQITHKVLSTE